jgi:hypothetical protein
MGGAMGVLKEITSLSDEAQKLSQSIGKPWVAFV